VAAGIVPAALGTDTVGSIRIPACLCGVSGLRPTFGLCPTDGVAPLAASLDCVGPIARTARDLALLLSVMAADTSLGQPGESGNERVTVIEGPFPVAVDAAVASLLDAAVHKMRRAGVKVQQAQCDAFELAPRVAGPIVGYEAARAWAWALEQHRSGLGEEVSGHLRKGASMPDARYQRAREDRARISEQIEALLRDADLLVLPTTATAATPWRDPGPQLAFLGLCAGFSLTGHPACSVPMGAVDGLPVGLQIAGHRGADATVLRMAARLEKLLKGS
jgi:Asp-tRNA(Asn)/Glu-tRNA(Gln) amidotransferase A subunit family amidase